LLPNQSNRREATLGSKDPIATPSKFLLVVPLSEIAASELANENAMAKATEIGWRKNQTPRSIKQGPGLQALQQLAIRRKDIHSTKLRIQVHKILCLILLGKRPDRSLDTAEQTK
jgi:hypothetical protein